MFQYFKDSCIRSLSSCSRISPLVLFSYSFFIQPALPLVLYFPCHFSTTSFHSFSYLLRDSDTPFTKHTMHLLPLPHHPLFLSPIRCLFPPFFFLCLILHFLFIQSYPFIPWVISLLESAPLFSLSQQFPSPRPLLYPFCSLLHSRPHPFAPSVKFIFSSDTHLPRTVHTLLLFPASLPSPLPLLFIIRFRSTLPFSVHPTA